MRDRQLQMNRIGVIATLTLIVWTCGGCRTSPPLQADGLPGEQYLVGGGMMIDWEAPTAGTAYLVEKTSGKIIETRSVAQGDSYTFSIASGGQAAEFEKMLGIKFSEARLLLYFQPQSEKGLRP